MRKNVLTVLGVLLIAAALTIQMATAAARNARKAARAPAPVTQQLRERHGLSAPAAIHNRSCDILWCYED
jgi:type II secretory pathway pseudopilin PulG